MLDGSNWERASSERIGSALLFLFAVFAFVFAADNSYAASTSIGPNGVVLIDGQPAFPIGLSEAPPHDVPAPGGGDPLAQVRAAGVTVMRVTPPTLWYTDAFPVRPYPVAWLTRDNDLDPASVDYVRVRSAKAASRGLGIWLNLRTLNVARPATPESVVLEQIVSEFADDPALYFWKGMDEPFGSFFTPNDLQPAYEYLHAADPAHTSILIQAPDRGTDADIASYAAVTDNHGVDIYPVRWRFRADPDLHRVGLNVAKMRRVTPNRSIFATLQICSSGSDDGWMTRGEERGRYVMPTRRQERYMIYDAIMNGARGIFFFGGQVPHCLPAGDPDAPYRWKWSFWNGILKRLIAEVNDQSELYPALVNPGTGPVVRVNRRNMQIRTRQANGVTWILASRHGRYRKTVVISGLPRDVTRATVYAEGRTIPVVNGRLTDRFRRWSVHVYKLG